MTYKDLNNSYLTNQLKKIHDQFLTEYCEEIKPELKNYFEDNIIQKIVNIIRFSLNYRIPFLKADNHSISENKQEIFFNIFIHQKLIKESGCKQIFREEFDEYDTVCFEFKIKFIEYDNYLLTISNAEKNTIKEFKIEIINENDLYKIDDFIASFIKKFINEYTKNNFQQLNQEY